MLLNFYFLILYILAHKFCVVYEIFKLYNYMC